jgi:serine/threonine-protein kinase
MAEWLGPYELRGELGRGAMAVVWRAFDPKLEREVAIKEPIVSATADDAVRADLSARFVREGKAAAQLNHPGIVTIHDADVFDGRPAIVMELIEGQTLSSLLEWGPLSQSEAVAILEQLLDAAGYAHQRGVVHRDIKPDNVFVTPQGRVKLADFGIAHIGGSATVQTQAGTVMGTPGYMAPEQVTGGAVDARTDIFAIGVIAYEIFTGRNPFGTSEGVSPTTVMYRIVHEVPTPVASTDASTASPMAPVVARAMAKNSADRYQDAAQMRGDLRYFAEGSGSSASPTAPVATGPYPHSATLGPENGLTLADLARPTQGSPWNANHVYAAVGVLLVAGLLFVLIGSSVPTGGGSGGTAVSPNDGPRAKLQAVSEAMTVLETKSIAGAKKLASERNLTDPDFEQALERAVTISTQYGWKADLARTWNPDGSLGVVATAGSYDPSERMSYTLTCEEGDPDTVEVSTDEGGSFNIGLVKENGAWKIDAVQDETLASWLRKW